MKTSEKFYHPKEGYCGWCDSLDEHQDHCAVPEVEALEAVAAAARDWRVLGMLSKPRTAESPERRTTRNRLCAALDRLNERTD